MAGRPKTGEVIKNVLGYSLSYPCVTRWNSFFDAVRKILNGKSKMEELFLKLNLQKLTDIELAYLEEYCELMAPIANALDLLHGDKYCYLGYVLPTIFTIRTKFVKLEISGKINILHELIFKLTSALQSRFNSLFELEVKAQMHIIAAILCPDVKPRWLPTAKKINKKFDIDLVYNTITNSIYSNDASVQSSVSTLETNSFFDFDEQGFITHTHIMIYF